MFNTQTISVIALTDLFYIVVFYIIMSLFFKVTDRWFQESTGEEDPRWKKVEKFINKFHVMKILSAAAAFLILRANIEIISNSISSDMQPIDIFGKINLMMVADVIAIMFVQGNRFPKVKKG
jgi:hypothetical protein